MAVLYCEEAEKYCVARPRNYQRGISFGDELYEAQIIFFGLLAMYAVIIFMLVFFFKVRSVREVKFQLLG